MLVGTLTGPRGRPPRRPPRSPSDLRRLSRTGSTHGSSTASSAAASAGPTSTRRRRSRPSTTGQDVVVVTPTASGKTLCYALPILQAIAEDPAARALLLFPTKALGQDQVTEFGELTAAAEPDDLDLDLRRRHAGPDPVGDPGGRPGRRDQPGHAPFGDPAPPHEVVPAVRAAPLSS